VEINGKIRKAAAVALGVVLLGVAGGAVSADGGVNVGPTRARPRAGASSPTETVFVPIVPCRIFSSVPAVGKFSAGETRSINKGGNLSSQGGNPAGCGIPDGATALEVNITSALAEGNGYIRVWPDESVEQGATFMNFSNAFNVSNAGTVAVDKGATDVMDLKVYLNRTHVIIDVMGYYVDELFAVVEADGTLSRGNGVASVTKLASAGQYVVNFERNVRGCSYAGNLGVTGAAGAEADGTLSLQGASSNPTNGVFVWTFNTAGAPTNRAFQVIVDC
jgi:hypothetical protein